jgi:hypothetical protein
MSATRERKLEFIRSFGVFQLEQSVSAMLQRKKSPWLTDEQIDDITDQLVSDARWTQHHNMRERSKARASQEYRNLELAPLGGVSAQAAE